MAAAAAKVTLTLEDEVALAKAEILAGDGAAAITRLSALIEASGFSPVLHYWLSAAHGAAGDKEKQRETLRTAQAYHGLQVIKDGGGDLIRFQQDPAYAALVADTFYANKMVACAGLAYGRAATQPDATAKLMISYGLSLQHQGLVDDAAAVFGVIAETFPVTAIHEFLLTCRIYAEGGVARHALEARRWAARYAPTLGGESLGRESLTFSNRPLAGRPLRIGYVAPSFSGAKLRAFILPVLENHDPAAVEVYLYCADRAADADLPAAKVQSIGHLSDANTAALIKRDQIDVLVDLGGHAAGGRLAMFALKPAPVQVSWLSQVHTTGLEAMDYALHCESLESSEQAELFTETIWAIGAVAAPYRPNPSLLPTATPALRNGYVTFGSFNNPCQLGDQTVKAWAGVLNANPGSKLILRYEYFIDPVLQNATCARFAAFGADPDQLDFRWGADVARDHADVDLALDPSPCPGVAATWEALAHGVPVLSLRGEDFHARMGVACLAPLGLEDLLADSWDEYVRLSHELTMDFTALDALRRRVSKSFDASPARDEAGFTRDLEAAFGEMFEAWREAAPVTQ